MRSTRIYLLKRQKKDGGIYQESVTAGDVRIQVSLGAEFEKYIEKKVGVLRTNIEGREVLVREEKFVKRKDKIKEKHPMRNSGIEGERKTNTM